MPVEPAIHFQKFNGETIFAKIHNVNGEQVLACCEKELIGKKIQNEKYDFEIKESFYKGFEITQEELKEKLQEIGNINLIGKQPVEIALQFGLVSKASVIDIDGIHHVQIFKL